MHNNKKQINKDSDENPKTEKHLPRSRLNFIWDSKRKYSKSIRRIIEKYIFHVSLVWRHEAPRHMTELVLSQHCAMKALDFFDFSSWKFHYFSHEKWKKSSKVSNKLARPITFDSIISLQTTFHDNSHRLTERSFESFRW